MAHGRDAAHEASYCSSITTASRKSSKTGSKISSASSKMAKTTGRHHSNEGSRHKSATDVVKTDGHLLMASPFYWNHLPKQHLPTKATHLDSLFCKRPVSEVALSLHPAIRESGDRTVSKRPSTSGPSYSSSQVMSFVNKNRAAIDRTYPRPVMSPLEYPNRIEKYQTRLDVLYNVRVRENHANDSSFARPQKKHFPDSTNSSVFGKAAIGQERPQSAVANFISQEGKELKRRKNFPDKYQAKIYLI